MNNIIYKYIKADFAVVFFLIFRNWRIVSTQVKWNPLPMPHLLLLTPALVCGSYTSIFILKCFYFFACVTLGCFNISRGAIYYRNITFVVLPLPCPTCDPQTAPHIVLPWWSTEIAQSKSHFGSIDLPPLLDTSMRTFWKPVDLMAMMQAAANSQQFPDPTEEDVHTIWLEFIVNENLVRVVFPSSLF